MTGPPAPRRSTPKSSVANWLVPLPLTAPKTVRVESEPAGPGGPGGPVTFQVSDVSAALQFVTESSITRSAPPDFG